MNLLQMIQASKNPQSLLIQLVKTRMGNNPMADNLIQMIQTGNMSGIEQLARNICKESGQNPDQLLQQILKQ